MHSWDPKVNGERREILPGLPWLLNGSPWILLLLQEKSLLASYPLPTVTFSPPINLFSSKSTQIGDVAAIVFGCFATVACFLCAPASIARGTMVMSPPSGSDVVVVVRPSVATPLAPIQMAVRVRIPSSMLWIWINQHTFFLFLLLGTIFLILLVQ